MHRIVIGFVLTVALLGQSSPAVAAKRNRKPAEAPKLLANPAVVNSVHEWITRCCTQPVTQLLSNWKSSDQWIGSPPRMDGGRPFRTPTQKIGVWIQLTFFPNQTVEASRITANTSTRVHWRQADCTPHLETQKRRPSSVTSISEFSDQTLAAVLKNHPKGLIYAWSPHMPLSWRGYSEAKAMAAKLHLEFVPVFDPSASPSAAKETAKQQHFDSQSLRRITAIELLARGVNQHYPCVIAFSEHQIQQPSLSGILGQTRCPRSLFEKAFAMKRKTIFTLIAFLVYGSLAHADAPDCKQLSIYSPKNCLF